MAEIQTLSTVGEQVTAQVTGVIVDLAGTAIPGANLTTCTLTVYSLDDPAKPIVNSIDGVNILNAGRGTIDGSGNLTLILDAADNPILDDTRLRERHMLKIDFSWNGGLRDGRFKAILPVSNDKKVT